MTIAQALDLAAIALLAASIPAALLIWAGRAWRHAGLARQAALSPMALPVLTFTAALLVSRFAAVSDQHATWRVLVWGGYLGIFGLILAVPERWVTKAVTVVGWPVALWSIGEAIITMERAERLQGNANILAAWLIPVAFLGRSNVLNGCSVVAMALTGSRGALLGALGAFLAKHRVATKVVLLAALLASLLALLRPSTIRNRLGNWQEAGRLFLERPLMGWGAGCYTLLAENEPEHPHADGALPTIAAEQGIIGLASFLWLAVTVGRLAARSDHPARWGLLAVGLHNLVDYTLWWYWPGLMLMIMMALVVK
jgi:hypothetical protein